MLSRQIESIYIDSAQITLWKRSIFIEVNKELNNVNRGKLSVESWNSLISSYMIGIYHSPENVDQLYFGVLDILHKHTSLPVQKLIDIFTNSEYKLPVINMMSTPNIEAIALNDNTYNIVCGDVSLRMSTLHYNAYGQQPQFKELLLRYSMLNTIEWSIPQSIFTLLESPTTIECFASPFNYTANNFLSIYPIDQTLIYPPNIKCHGNFMKLILPESPITFIVHPPNVNMLISHSIDLVIKHSDNHPGSLVVMLLPNIKDILIVRKLLDHPLVSSYTLMANKYQLYDQLTGTDSIPSFDSLLIIKHDTDSQQIADQYASYHFGARY